MNTRGYSRIRLINSFKCFDAANVQNKFNLSYLKNNQMVGEMNYLEYGLTPNVKQFLLRKNANKVNMCQVDRQRICLLINDRDPDSDRSDVGDIKRCNN